MILESLASVCVILVLFKLFRYEARANNDQPTARQIKKQITKQIAEQKMSRILENQVITQENDSARDRHFAHAIITHTLTRTTLANMGISDGQAFALGRRILDDQTIVSRAKLVG